MNRTLLVCLLAGSIAAPSISNAATSRDDDRSGYPRTMVLSMSEERATWSSSVKPGKSKKYKKKMNKQMKKRKRH